MTAQCCADWIKFHYHSSITYMHIRTPTHKHIPIHTNYITHRSKRSSIFIIPRQYFFFVLANCFLVDSRPILSKLFSLITLIYEQFILNVSDLSNYLPKHLTNFWRSAHIFIDMKKKQKLHYKITQFERI